jgi:lipoprotein-anchoring transpeptidase ErfK/SrfK
MDSDAPDSGGTPHQRSLRVLAVSVLLAAVTVAIGAKEWIGDGQATAEPTTTTVAPTTTSTAPQPRPQVPVETTLATGNGSIPAYDAPNGKGLGSIGFWYGYQMTMPVIERQPGWLRVRTPERPNQSTAWVRESDVALSSTPYRIVIHRGQTNVTVYEKGFPLFTIPAGLGKASTPTPLGSFFVGVIESGSGGYGPIILDTTAHSEAIQSWEGSGDAVIALHGPISASSDARIATTGTYISNGCVRLHRADQERLSIIPLGTPVDIVA